jgi:hypothetical protein
VLDDITGVMVCLGQRVAAAMFGALELPVPEPHVWVSTDFDMLQAVVVPHPSGLNRVLNDPLERERVGVTLRRALELGAAS